MNPVIAASISMQRNKDKVRISGNVCCCDPEKNIKCIQCFALSYIGVIILIAIL